MAARFSGKDHTQVTLEEEREALESCLRLRSTSKSHGGAGIGLTEVLDDLSDLHGLIRIRSGRTSIFKAFTPGASAQELHAGFGDWYVPPMPLQPVSGTVVSIFIPLPKV